MSDDDCMPKIDKILVAKIDAEELEKCANANDEEIILEKNVKPREQNEMFKEEKTVINASPIENPITIEVIETEKKEVVEEEEEKEEEEKVKKPKKKKPKKLYPHLEKARAKAKENRARRKAEKDKLKKETKEQKKEARKEKQRENARNHYWENKVNDDEDEKRIDVIVKDERVAETKGMNYEEFSGFMDKYNFDRDAKKQKIKDKREAVVLREKMENENIERKKRLTRNMVKRQNIRGMYVDDEDYPNDFFF